MSVVADNLKYIYTVKEAGPRAFTMPKGFREEVEVHLWGAGGGAGSLQPGGGGGYVTSIVTIAEGDIVEIGVGRQGSPASRATPGAGGSSSIGFRYSGGIGGSGTDEDGDAGAGGGGGGATVILVNGIPVAVAAGGGGGGSHGEDWSGGGTPGYGGGNYIALTSNTQGGAGTNGVGGGGGGGGGYLGGAGASSGTGAHGGSGGGPGGSGGQNYANGTNTLLISGARGGDAGGRNTEYAPVAGYGDAGQGGYAVIILTRRFNVNVKEAGSWKRINNAWVRINGDATSPQDNSEVFSTVGTHTFTPPSNVKYARITYPTPNGLVTTTVSVSGSMSVKIGGYGEESRFGPYVIPAYEKPVFRYTGNVDHLLNADVKVVTPSGAPLTVSGQNAAQQSTATQNGIYYNVTYEGWHGDLASTLYFTPCRSNTIVNSIRIVGSSNAGRYPGQPTFTAEPTSGNNYVMGIQIYDPYGGEGSYDVVASVQQIAHITVDYTIPGDGGWKEVYQIYEKVNGNWLPYINRRNIEDGRSRKWLVEGTYNWTAPADIIRVKAMVYGAGGSGTGGAGGAGGYSEKYLSVTPGESYVVIVGAGGVGDQAGQSSSFNGNIIANGGGAGTASSYGTDAGGAGGTAEGGDINLTGASGSAGQAVYHYYYWWWGWGGYYGWSGYNYYGYNNYGYGGFGGNAIYGYNWGNYWGGYWGWGWPRYHYSGYNFGTPGEGYDHIGSGAVGRSQDSPTGMAGAVFLIY